MTFCVLSPSTIEVQIWGNFHKQAFYGMEQLCSIFMYVGDVYMYQREREKQEGGRVCAFVFRPIPMTVENDSIVISIQRLD